VNGESFIQLLEQGGVVMYPLLLCSVVTVAIIIERSWTIAKAARTARHLHQLVEESLREQNIADAAAICRRDSSPLGPVFRAVITATTPEERLRLAQRKLSEASRQLKRFIWLLGTVGSLAPFIGLFGTVVGIIRAFENMAATGSGGFAVVAAGISEALVATAGGLLVGVLSIFAYNASMVRVNGLTAELREHTEDLLAWLSAPREGALPRVVQSR
jgi:biopolymer transport protein ExbB